MGDTIIGNPDLAGRGGATRTPWHLWAVGAAALVWNGFGAVDYVMTRTRNEAYLGQLGDAQAILQYIDGFPLWASVGWGLGIWGAVAGAVLLLLRSRQAVSALAVSLVGMVLSFGWQFLGPPPPAAMTEGPTAIIPVVIAVAAVLFLLYARFARRRGLLH